MLRFFLKEKKRVDDVDILLIDFFLVRIGFDVGLVIEWIFLEIYIIVFLFDAFFKLCLS